MKENNNKFYKASIIVTMIILISKISGLLRDVFIAKTFGANLVTDAFFVSLSIPLLITNIIGFSIHTGLISYFAKFKNNNNRNLFFKKIVRFASIISIFIFVIVFLFAPNIISLIAPGFGQETKTFTIEYTRILSITIIFLIIVQIYSALINYNRNYYISSSITIPSNLIYIIFLSIFGLQFGINGVLYITIFNALFQFIIMFFYSRKYFKNDKNDENSLKRSIKPFIYFCFPIFITSLVQQINTLIGQSISTNFDGGFVSSIAYSGRINGLIYSLLVLSITTVIYPELSRNVNKGEMEKFHHNIFKGLSLIFIISAPIVAGGIILRTEIISFLFEGGNFDISATLNTANNLGSYLLGLTSYGIILFMSKVFYSIKKSKVPMFIMTGLSILNVVLYFYMIPLFGGFGIPLAYSISGIIFSFISFLVYKKIFKNIQINKYIYIIIKITVSLLFFILILATTKTLLITSNFTNLPLIEKGIKLSILFLLACSTYIIFLFLFKINNNFKDKEIFI